MGLRLCLSPRALGSGPSALGRCPGVSGCLESSAGDHISAAPFGDPSPVTNEDYATRVAQFRCGRKRGRAHTRFETSRRSSNHVPDPVGSSAPSYSCRLAEPAGLLACLGDSVRRPLGAAGVGGGWPPLACSG